jgi:hypothetical protein
MEDDDSVSADDDDDEYTSQSSNEDAEEAESPQSSPKRKAKASIKAAAPKASPAHSGTKRKKLPDTIKTPPKKKIRTIHDKVSPLENMSTPPLLKTTTPSPRRSRNKRSSTTARSCSTDPLDMIVPATGVESLLFVQLDDDGGDEETGSSRILDGASGATGRMEQIDDTTGEGESSPSERFLPSWTLFLTHSVLATQFRWTFRGFITLESCCPVRPCCS